MLQAVANRIHVIASKNCGLENIAEITGVGAGDVEQLRSRIKEIKRGLKMKGIFEYA
ncbi:MAG: hypothetical protein M3R11_08785 [Acidobacteriota bacterium]|nr:hypothetical protein [Acidobacteriota bacterium]